MAIIQVSEKIIKGNFPTLESILKQELHHNESDLYYNNDLVYKIIIKIYRSYRQRYMWILDQNKFNYCLNIENLLYQGDKFIGCTTKLQKNLKSLEKIMETTKIDFYEAKEIFEIMFSVQKELLKFNLCYTDPQLSNIGINNGIILLSDLDGVDYHPDETLRKWSYINFYKTYLCLLLNENLYKYKENFFKYIFGEDITLEILEKYFNDVTKNKVDELQEKFYTYRKILKNKK